MHRALPDTRPSITLVDADGKPFSPDEADPDGRYKLIIGDANQPAQATAVDGSLRELAEYLDLMAADAVRMNARVRTALPAPEQPASIIDLPRRPADARVTHGGVPSGR